MFLISRLSDGQDACSGLSFDTNRLGGFFCAGLEAGLRTVGPLMMVRFSSIAVDLVPIGHGSA